MKIGKVLIVLASGIIIGVLLTVCFYIIRIENILTEETTPVVETEIEQYSDTEKFFIEALKRSLHDPSSLDIVSMYSMQVSELNSLMEVMTRKEKNDAKLKLKLVGSNPIIYMIRFRASNAFGAIRLGSIIAMCGESAIELKLYPLCVFIDYED